MPVDEALHTARATRDEEQLEPGRTSSEQTLAALLLLREARDQLAEWEPGLIEAAREAGVSWADLAHPLGVSTRQAAERRYLRIRPGQPGCTGEQRVQATYLASDHPDLAARVDDVARHIDRLRRRSADQRWNRA
ncbi:hypothetical protein ABT187_04175 [Streptomyces sp. NPDC001817]|uniref:hypothetical protein n=1 Tax=Streptomyces sp. NPDC001817 TaxID=3154398 RepID=UPI00331EFA81